MSDRLFTILITGNFDAGDRYIEKMPENISVEVIPFIRIEPVSDGQHPERIGELSRSSINAVFTSAEAVRAVKASINQSPAWTGWCTPGPTQTELRRWLGPDASITSAPDAATLAEALVSEAVSEAVFFCGNQRRDVLPFRLKSAGIALEEIVVYRTVAIPVHLEQEYDALLFFSPSAVESFLSVNGIAGKTAVFALGTTTADALRKRIPGHVMISPQPDKFSLLQTAIDYANAHLII